MGMNRFPGSLIGRKTSGTIHCSTWNIALEVPHFLPGLTLRDPSWHDMAVKNPATSPIPPIAPGRSSCRICTSPRCTPESLRASGPVIVRALKTNTSGSPTNQNIRSSWNQRGSPPMKSTSTGSRPASPLKFRSKWSIPSLVANRRKSSGPPMRSSMISLIPPNSLPA